jgi:hypothetical protein
MFLELPIKILPTSPMSIKSKHPHPFTIIAEDQTIHNINGYNNMLSTIHIDWNITWCHGNVIVLMHSNNDNEHIIDAPPLGWFSST